MTWFYYNSCDASTISLQPTTTIKKNTSSLFYKGGNWSKKILPNGTLNVKIKVKTLVFWFWGSFNEGIK